MAFKKGQLRVLSHAWDRNLGGRDLDNVLFEHFAQEFQEKYKLDVHTNLRGQLPAAHGMREGGASCRVTLLCCICSGRFLGPGDMDAAVTVWSRHPCCVHCCRHASAACAVGAVKAILQPCLGAGLPSYPLSLLSRPCQVGMSVKVSSLQMLTNLTVVTAAEEDAELHSGGAPECGVSHERHRFPQHDDAREVRGAGCAYSGPSPCAAQAGAQQAAALRMSPC